MKKTLKEEVIKQFWKSVYMVLRDRYAIKGGIVIPKFCTIKPNEKGIRMKKQDMSKTEAYRLFLEDWEKSLERIKRKKPNKSQIEIMEYSELIEKYGSTEGWFKNPEGLYERKLLRTKKRDSDDIQ